ncbi:hypothetical protein D1BOALGB6SA_3007 [Olavius sp. associated proteobacterium Delta 1]|nr:hypothetical protein D1BOALGB6SA_3007 [Olavius sp. associated proteobacterium Delta 1]
MPSNESRQIAASSGDLSRGCATIEIALFIFYEVDRFAAKSEKSLVPRTSKIVDLLRPSTSALSGASSSASIGTGTLTWFLAPATAGFPAYSHTALSG